MLLAASSWMLRHVPVGVLYEGSKAAFALEAKGGCSVASRETLPGWDVAAAYEAAGRGLESSVLNNHRRHHTASTMICPLSIPIWQVNSCLPGSPERNSRGTTRPVGSEADLP